MKAFGAPDHVIQEKLGLTNDSIGLTIQVWKLNSKAVEVFQSCRPDMQAGLSGLLYEGISSQEMLAAMDLLCIEREERPDIARDVQFMGSISATLRNSRRS